MNGPPRTLPPAAHLRARAARVMRRHWRPEGYTVPHGTRYPHQWLWDSAFHAVIWAHLGREDRARAELRRALAAQGPDGFVPHMIYHGADDAARAFWGRPGTSCITQPPMFGHALAELHRRGAPLERELLDAAAGAVLHLGRRRRDPTALIPLLHPWESGCDDSPRWDAWCPGASWSRGRWWERKGELVRSLEFDRAAGGRGGPCGPVANPGFEVGSVAFSALVAFNAAELLEVRPATGGAGAATAGIDDELRGELHELVGTLGEALAGAWDPLRATWCDRDGTPAAASASSRTRTLEALLPTLLGARVGEAAVTAAFAQLTDRRAFDATYGPAQVHRDEPTFDPVGYWRGAAWPQLTYLLWVAARTHGSDPLAGHLATALVRGADRSGFAEHWHPDLGDGGGARPQSWAALAAVVGARQWPSPGQAPRANGGR